MSIHKFIFTGLSGEQKSLALLLQKEYGHLNPRITWQFFDDPAEIRHHGEGTPLVVASSLCADLKKHLYLGANPLFLPWDALLSRLQKILSAPAPLSLRKVALAFLDRPLGTLLSRIFDLYGYRTVLIESLQELDRIEAEKIDYLVLNLDMPLSPGANRNVVLKDLKGVLQRNPHISVNVIKDFDLGSLYDDIKSPVKDFCNLLLSPEEYITFIKKFLYQCELERLFYINRNGAPSPLESNHRMQKPLKNNFIHLKNPKQIFARIMEKPDSSLWRYGMEEIAMIEFRREALMWLDDYLISQTRELPRGSFSFIQDGAEAVSLVESFAH